MLYSFSGTILCVKQISVRACALPIRATGFFLLKGIGKTLISLCNFRFCNTQYKFFTVVCVMGVSLWQAFHAKLN